jgi:hypothetical protein
MNTPNITFESLKLTKAEMEAIADGARQFVDPTEDPRDSERYDEVVDAEAP